MADKRIIELEERLTLSNGDYLATDNTNGTCKVNAKILLDRLSDNEDAIATKAAKVDLTNISITGSTNNTGSTITSGSFFYKNGTLVRAKTDIANNAALTRNTNYEIVTAGGLNALNNALTWKTNSNLHTTGSTSISLPSTFKELLIEIHYMTSNLAWTFYAITEELSSTTKYLLSGSASGVGSNSGAAIAITSSTVSIADAKISDSSIVSSCEITVYYR